MYCQPIHHNHTVFFLPPEHNEMGYATPAERSATHTIIMVESLKMSATFKASCIKSCTAPFCHDFAYTALKFYCTVSSFTVFHCVWN